MQIPITQFMRPNGRPVQQHLEVDEQTAYDCGVIRMNGYRFECEELINGLVSLTITDDECDHAIEMCNNAPGQVLEAFKTMTSKFVEGIYSSV
mgnify:CR=1 FL=1